MAGYRVLARRSQTQPSSCKDCGAQGPQQRVKTWHCADESTCVCKLCAPAIRKHANAKVERAANALNWRHWLCKVFVQKLRMSCGGTNLLCRFLSCSPRRHHMEECYGMPSCGLAAHNVVALCLQCCRYLHVCVCWWPCVCHIASDVFCSNNTPQTLAQIPIKVPRLQFQK